MNSTVTCVGCGALADEANPRPSACAYCPPVECAACGWIDHLATEQSCLCWTPLDLLPFADIKGLFAAEGLTLTREVQS